MRIFITGISGFLGINLVRYLFQRGFDQINGIDIAEFNYPERERINFLLGDIRNSADVQKSMEGADIVIHTAAALPLYTPEDIYSTEVDGTRVVLDQALKNGVQRFIHISTTAVYGIPDHHPIIENDPVNGVGPYGIAKVKAEELCREYREKGLCIPILRPKSFVGPERLGVFAIFYEWASDGRNFPMIGSGSNRYQLLDVVDLCQAIVACINVDKAKVNDTFNIGANQFSTMKQDYQAVLDDAGFGKKIICFPETPVVFALRVMDKINLSPLYPWIYETAAKDSFVSTEKAESILGYHPKFSNRDAMLRNYRWYLQNKERFDGHVGVSHRLPWRQKGLKILKYIF